MAMKIAISGASGLVGTALTHELTGAGHDVVPLARRRAADGSQSLDRVEGSDTVVHLAGENLVRGRWTTAKKRRIWDSRVGLTTDLAQSLAELAEPPETLICASAIGYYGERGDARLDEDSAPGEGFLADLCRAWENACQPAAKAGIRVVNLRIGIVLSTLGGALKLLLPAFRLGLGGRIGDGGFYMSWIHIGDLSRLIGFLLANQDLSGPVNAVAPAPVTNLEFTKTLGEVLRRPTILPVPRFLLRAGLGEVADVITTSAAVVPRQARAAGFEFGFGTLAPALEDLLQRTSAGS